MNAINFKKEVSSSVTDIIPRLEKALKTEGFGILTRIDFDSKIKEKLNKDISQVVILGACNPELAFEAFQRNKDVTSLLPCNVVIRELGHGKVSIEVAKPTALMEILGDKELVNLAKDADKRLSRMLEVL